MLQTTQHLVHRNSTEVVEGAFDSLADTDILTANDLDFLSHGRCFIRKLEVGNTLFGQGSHSDHVYVLLAGWAFCYKVLEDGRRQILDLVLPGGILGFNATEFAQYGVEAKTDCKVAVFNRQSFNLTLLKDPALCLKCANLFAHAETRALERLSRVGRLSAVERVSGLIVELARRLNAIDEQRHGALRLMLTQAEIADMLGLAKETVCRALMALRKSQVVRLDGGVLAILDFDGLLEAAGDDADIHHDGSACCAAKLAA
jgi:CRP/FNR family transcriptional regulator, anaerobic regulatory protein